MRVHNIAQDLTNLASLNVSFLLPNMHTQQHSIWTYLLMTQYFQRPNKSTLSNRLSLSDTTWSSLLQYLKWRWLEVRTSPVLLLWASLLSDITIYVISLLRQELFSAYSTCHRDTHCIIVTDIRQQQHCTLLALL